MTLTKSAQMGMACAMLFPEQCRAARAWLGWSQEDLAKRANVGLSTLKDFENGKRSPMRNNREAMRRVLEDAGIGLLFDKGGKPHGITSTLQEP